ncbi:NAD-dependent epimerase/dehydratase family protein [Enterococcus casseliflavus]|uniref:NAD-dependent epimerase/dehydratase family protein n=1 Tax=Enterococcus casseliflavus TaxID=37734 RepID=UPI003EE11CC8
MKSTVYLVTGAAGLLGSNISRNLVSRGEKVRGLVLSDDPSIKYIPDEVEIIEGDITNKDDLINFFNVEEEEIIVIHCASIVTVSDEANPKVYEVNVKGTKYMLDFAISKKVKKFVYISSTSAIPELPGNKEIKEVNQFYPEDIIGYYGKKKAASQLVMDAFHENDLDVSLIFPTGICGPNDYAYGPVSTFIIEYTEGKMRAGVEGYFNAVDVRDLAQGCISCAEKGKKGESYIMGNELVSMKYMFSLLSRLTGGKEVHFILPSGVAKIFGKFGDAYSKISKKPVKLTSFAVYNLTRNNNFSYNKAIAELDYKVRPFSQTIQDEIQWLKTEGKI